MSFVHETSTTRVVGTNAGQAASSARPRAPRVFMMDLLATVPYYTAYLSRALLTRGVRVVIGSISYYLDPGCFSSRGLRLEPGCLNLIGGLPLPKAPRRVLKLAEHLINLIALTLRFLVRPPDIIHVQYLPLLRWPVPIDVWFIRLCQRRGSRLVLTVHDLLPHDTGDRYTAIFERLYRSMDALICHSEVVKARLHSEFGIAEEKISVIPHGPFFYDLPTDALPDARARLGIPAGHSVVLWQGIIFPYKGLDLLLKAWQRVEAEVATAHLVIVGTGSPEMLAETRTAVQAPSLQRVKLDLRFASTEELVAVYRAADVVVYPYRAITTSGALATGLALGKAIVASDLSVFRELLTHGENALLVPVGDTDRLASTILTLLLDTGQRESLQDHVRSMDFGPESWVTIADKTLAVYRSVVPARHTLQPTNATFG